MITMVDSYKKTKNKMATFVVFLEKIYLKDSLAMAISSMNRYLLVYNTFYTQHNFVL